MTGPWLTPAAAEQLSAQAQELYRRVRVLDLARAGDLDDDRRLAGFRLDVVLGALRQAAEELHELGVDLGRLAARPADACPLPSGVCPEHGPTLAATGSRSWCQRPGCGRSWDYPRVVERCTEPRTHHVVDAEGSEVDVCAGHAIDASRRLLGATVTLLVTA